MNKPIVVVGAGAAGLSCAIHLREAERDVVLLEADNEPGGRMRTDLVEGFRLDHGFQVFQTAYPEAKKLLDYDRLELVELEPGALVRKAGQWVCMSDPLRRPGQAWGTIFNSIGTFPDRLKLLQLKRYCAKQDALQSDLRDQTTQEFLLEKFGFSSDIVDCFFRPWLSGIFLETKLQTSAKYFCFVFRMLAAGPIMYPQQGIQAIPNQLAERLGRDRIRLGCSVQEVSRSEVVLHSGERLAADHVVLAIGDAGARRLLEHGPLSEHVPQAQVVDEDWSSTACLYFTCSHWPHRHKSLLLNGEGEGPVNHVMVLTDAVPGISATDTLVSVNLVDQSARDYFKMPEETERRVREQMKDWFGETVGAWQLLRAYSIPRALPKQSPGFYESSARAQQRDGIYVCGDDLETSSFQGALLSGRRAAEAVLAEANER